MLYKKLMFALQALILGDRLYLAWRYSEVGLDPGHIVLDGDLASSTQKGGTSSPLAAFSAHLLWPYGSMDQDSTWYGGRPRPRSRCVGWGPSSPPPKKIRPWLL